MKILAIGGLGFIGHHLSRSLIDHGHEVMILDNVSDYGLLDPIELKKIVALRLDRLAHHSGIVKGDVNEPNFARSIIGDFKPDCVVYLAAYPRAKAVDLNLELAYKTMVTSLRTTAEAALEVNSRFAFISSSMVYGEWPSHSIDESYEPKPQGNYSNFKRQGELLLQAIMPEDRLFIARPIGVYGPYDVTDRVVSRMMQNAMNNQPIEIHGKDTMLDLTYIDDVTAMLRGALQSELSGTFNVSSGKSTALLELAQSIIEVTDSSSELIVTDRDQRYFQRGALDSTKIRSLLNYHEVHDLSTGLKNYYNWLVHLNA